MKLLARQPALSRHELYRAMGELLTAKVLPDFPESHWQILIHFSGDALITAQLCERLEKNGLLHQLPEEMRQYLTEVRSLNVERSAKLASTFLRLTQVLNRADIVPIGIKGIAFLFSSKAADAVLQSRICSDIDVLINTDELLPALNALQAVGYTQLIDPIRSRALAGDSMAAFDTINLGDHRNNAAFARAHVPPLVDAEAVCGIDLHTVVSNGDAKRVTALTRKVVEMSSQALSASDADARFALPAPAAQIVLCAYHSQIKNDHQWLGIVDWRLLLDMQWMLETHPDTDLVAETMRLALSVGIDDEMYTVWALVCRYLGISINIGSIQTTLRVRALRRFDRKSQTAWLSQCCIVLLHIKKSYQLITPRVFRESLGGQLGVMGIAAHLSYRFKRSLKR